MGLLTGRTALVTGAARGIGKAIALKFAKEGANIAFTDLAIDEEHGGKGTERDIEALGVKAKGYASNAADFAQTEETIKQVLADFGSIDILVNNAGITRDSMFHNMNDEQWDDVIKINLTGTFNCCKQVVPKMRQQKYGRILNMASCSPFGIVAGQANYSASKGGIIALTKTLAKELGRHNITVNAVAPGCIKTDMFNAIPEENLKEFLDKLIIQRLGEPDEVASLAAYLCSEESRYITGKCIACDGGLIPD